MFKLVKDREVLEEYGFVGINNAKIVDGKLLTTPTGQYIHFQANLIVYKNKRVVLYGKGAKFNNEFYKVLYRLIKDEVIEWFDE